MFDFIDLAPALIERNDDSDGHRGHHPFGVRGGRLVGGSSFPAATPERAGFRAYQTGDLQKPRNFSGFVIR